MPDIALRSCIRTYSRDVKEDQFLCQPYSDDLRTKAIAAVKRGERKTDVSRMLNISRNTLDLWVKREEIEGEYRALTNYQLSL